MAKRKPIDFKAVRRAVRFKDAVLLLGIPITWESGELLRIPCPVHGSRPGSRSLSANREVGHCFRCHWKGDAVALVAKVMSLDPLEAALLICDRLSLHVPYLP